jgi:hypothetical protein
VFSRPLKCYRQFDLTLKTEVAELEGMCIDRNVEYVNVRAAHPALTATLLHPAREVGVLKRHGWGERIFSRASPTIIQTTYFPLLYYF